ALGRAPRGAAPAHRSWARLRRHRRPARLAAGESEKRNSSCAAGAACASWEVHWRQSMMSRCDLEALEALAMGELDEARAAEVEAHAAGCASCKRELEWLRAEREVVSRRAAGESPVPAELWRGIEARIAPAPKRAARR